MIKCFPLIPLRGVGHIPNGNSLVLRSCFRVGKMTLFSSSSPSISLEQYNIQTAHDKACMEGKGYYIDPVTRYKVMTSETHLKRGKCCGSKCRHCPFDHVNVVA